jgi:hypothetical protein
LCFVHVLTFRLLPQSVTDKQTTLYNRHVASYHKAKGDRAEMARELEVARGKTPFSCDLSFFFGLAG